LQKILGTGNFGEVRSGIWRKSPEEKIPCACKTLKKSENLNELLEEILNMIKLQHEHIVVMYGVVVSKKELQIVNFLDIRLIDNSTNLSTSLIGSKNSESLIGLKAQKNAQ
jgi:serine/threonine protein kinase